MILKEGEMSRNEYWDECIAVSFDEHGITATAEQIKNVSGDVQSAHENYGMAHYTPENPLIGEVSRLKRDLVKEREKVICKICKGTGEIVSYGPIHSAYSQCFKCRGEGRHSP